MNKIDTVLFDLDQTLLDQNQSLLTFAHAQYERFSLATVISDQQGFVTKFIELNNRAMPKEELYEKLCDQFHLSPSMQADLLHDANTNFPVHCVGFPGLHEMLETLRQQGYKMGMITNGRDSYQRNKITALGIADNFSQIIVSEAVRMKKPDLDIFRLTLAGLGSRSECSVFVGDSMEYDIIPARELGMYTILKTKNENPYPSACCDDLLHIPEIVNLLGKNQE